MRIFKRRGKDRTSPMTALPFYCTILLMSTPRTLFALFAVIILEGYVVLSSELLAIRLTIPFVGSGTDSVSIIIAAVLMPLAFGYHAGGHFKAGHHKPFVIFGEKRFVSVRDKLVINMIIALLFLIFALSYSFLAQLFSSFLKAGITNRIILNSVYALIFVAPPVYLLGQTIPLACNFFSRERLAQITGRILFFSTLGSFLGAVFSTLVLMAHLGVNNTAIINFIILGSLITLLSKRKISERIAFVWACILIGALINSNYMMRSMKIVENNQYSTISAYEHNNMRYLNINGNSSSRYSDNDEKFEYASFMEFIAIDEAWREERPLDILVLGAGGFTLGAEDEFNHYEYVDIDPSLKEIAEEHLLKEELKPNKTFHPIPARAFLTGADKKYDVIILDVFSAALSIPEHLVTQEFFQQVRDTLKPNGKMLANFATAANFESAFSRNLDNTLRSVFPHVSRTIMRNEYDLGSDDETMLRNIVYIYNNRPKSDEVTNTIYTDRKNQMFLDQPTSRR